MVKIKKFKFKKQFLLISQVHGSISTSINHVWDKFHRKLLNFVNLYLIKKKKLTFF